MSYEQEIWVPVPDECFSNYYEVSNHGRVRSHDRVVIESSGRQRRHYGRILTNKKAGNYLCVSLYALNKSSRFYVHRLVAEAFVKNPDKKQFVNHINFNTHDNYASNLEWVTSKENTQHSPLAGRLGAISPRKGEDVHCSKLTEKDVQFLRQTWKPGQPILSIAKKYGVSNRALYQMLSGRTWKHIDPPVAINWPSES